MKKTTAALASLVVLAAAPALAGPAERGEDFRFTYDTRTMISDADVQREHTRLMRAVKQYCNSGSSGLAAHKFRKQCQAYVLNSCELQMPKTLLAYHRAMKNEHA